MFFKSADQTPEMLSSRDGLFLTRPSKNVQAHRDMEGPLDNQNQQVRLAKPDPRLMRAGVDELNEALRQAFEEEACHLASARLFHGAPMESVSS